MTAPITLTPAQLSELVSAAVRVALAGPSRSVQDDRAQGISENRIGEGCNGTDGKGNPMCRIDGPFRNRNKWRVRVVDRETSKARSYTYATEDEARQAIPKLAREYRRPVGVPLSDALSAYRTHLATRGNVPSRGPNKPRTIETTMGRLDSVFAGHGDTITGELTPSTMGQFWQAWAPSKATDTALNTLAQLRTFVRWLASKGWVKSTALVESIEVVGHRKKGKAQLTLDESRLFLAKAMELASARDQGAIAAATALLLGVRASEITDRVVRDLDGGGTILAIGKAKTRAGVRRIRVPEVLHPLLQSLAHGKGPTDRLFDAVQDRHAVLRAVRRVCRAANVPIVPAHGLRGTHATLAVDAGVTGAAVAASLGHESFGVTERHYADPGAVAGARIDRVSKALN